MVQLFKGSIFNSKCDLLIIPCNETGGVSSSIYHELTQHHLPTFIPITSPGDVVFLNNPGSFPNASIIGYAAAVDTSRVTSVETSLKMIMRTIHRKCLSDSLHKINIPLLGTGAGSLSPNRSYEILKTFFLEDPRISLCVYTISDSIYQELHPNELTTEMNRQKNPRVFISYTGTNPDNKKWVKSFATKLRSNGVNARLDIFHLKAGNDLPQWMTNELIMADKVLLICDKYYAEKADNRKGGVGWETMVIQGDMLTHLDSNKYIAIIRDSNIDQSLPIYVKSKFALNWANSEAEDREFDELLLNIFDCDDEPPLGEIPKHIREKLVLTR